jgi:hypothetical protein
MKKVDIIEVEECHSDDCPFKAIDPIFYYEYICTIGDETIDGDFKCPLKDNDIMVKFKVN